MCAADPSGAHPETINYSLRVIEYVSRQPPTGIEVKACTASDVNCDSPVATFRDKDGSGMVRLVLPYGFLGYLDVSSSAMHALSYVSKALRQDTQDRDLQVPTESTVGLLATYAGAPYDATRGVVLLEAFDCMRMPAGGVHFTESKGDSGPFYFVNQLPNREVKESVYDADRDVADGGFVNEPTGFVTFTAYLGVDGPKLGEFNASVRANTVTYVDMYF
jgi:hypothetical protein